MKIKSLKIIDLIRQHLMSHDIEASLEQGNVLVFATPDRIVRSTLVLFDNEMHLTHFYRNRIYCANSAPSMVFDHHGNLMCGDAAPSAPSCKR